MGLFRKKALYRIVLLVITVSPIGFIACYNDDINTTTATISPTTTFIAPPSTEPYSETVPSSPTMPMTTNTASSGQPVECAGEDPDSWIWYPGTIRIDYITTCPCSPGVDTWYVAPGKPIDVFEYYISTYTEDEWIVSPEPIGLAAWIDSSDEYFFLEIFEDSRWEGFPTAIHVAWLNPDHYQPWLTGTS